MLTEEKAFLDDFFKFNANGFCILNLKGEIITTNEAFCNTLGFEANELENKMFLELIAPQEQASVKKQFVEIIQNFRSSRNRFTHKDKHEVDLQWNITLQKEQKLLFITARQIDKKYKEIEDRSRIYINIIENNWDSIVFSDISGKILFANDSATKMYSYAKNELIGKNIEVFNSEEANQKSKEIVEYLKSYGGWSGEITHLRKDNTPFHVHLTISMIFNGPSHPIGLVSNTKDISQLKKVEKQLLEAKNKAEEASHKLTEEKDKLQRAHQDIQASINYAKYIQDAMLPRPNDINRYLPDSFLVFKPRDVVSGDFYWFAYTEPRPIYRKQEGSEMGYKILQGFENEKIHLAAVDCTGHGVPGAFMSVMFNTYLNEIIKSENIAEPHLILTQLDKKIRSALHQEDTDNKESADICLVSIDLQLKVLSYAGAKNPLYVRQGDEFKVIPATPRNVGGLMAKNVPFEKHTFDAKEPTTIYLFSDGYQDQFGGKKNRKFLKKNFRELIKEVSLLPMPEQKRILDERIEAWKGSYPQTDDILVMGFKIS